MLRALATTIVVATSLLLAVGCGGDDRVDYERELANVGAVVDDALDALPDEDSRTIGPARVATLANDLPRAADQLADLDPPEDAKDAQRRLERGLRGIADSYDDLATALRTAETDDEKSDVFVKFATNEQIDEAFEDVIAAQEAYAQDGYRVFGVTERSNSPANS